MKKILGILLLLSAVLIFGTEKKEVANTIKTKVQEIMPELIKIRRHLHENPELGNREFKTASLPTVPISAPTRARSRWAWKPW